MRTMNLRVAARKSDLARLQAYEVGRALERAHADVRVDYQFSTSLGDANLNDPLWKMPEKGVFTADLTEKLISGDCDLVVHSWKDLPTDPNPKTEIAATLKRADVRDVILVKRDFLEAAESGGSFRVFSSSPRREYNVRDFLTWSLPAGPRPNAIEFVPVRGNIATRAQKYLENREIAAWIVAKAALDRLLSSSDEEFAASRSIIQRALAQSRFQVIPVSVSPSAPAQGALAIEIARGREDVKARLDAIADRAAYADVTIEREIFRKYGGGCHQKIGVTCESRAFGRIETGRGQPDSGDDFAFERLIAPGTVEQFPRTTRDFVYPLTSGEAGFISGRKKISIDTRPLHHADLFVARAEALPDELILGDRRLIWVSGVQTWQKLANRGVWVTGCQDGRGENEPIGLDALIGRALRFTKFTHRAGHDRGAWPIVATYELIDKPETEWPDLSKKTHFYWSSFSQFERARRRYGDILAKGYHACGPGNTFEMLREVVSHVRVYLSHESWLEDVL